MPLFPEDFDMSGEVQDFLMNLTKLDEYFVNRVKFIISKLKMQAGMMGRLLEILFMLL